MPQTIDQKFTYDDGSPIAKENLEYFHGKPRGIWYGIGGNWLQFCLNEHPSGLHPYVYEIMPNYSRMLVLNNQEQLDKLEKEYGDWESVKPQKILMSPELLKHLSPYKKEIYVDKGLDSHYTRPWHMDWKKVASTFSGIEINPRSMSARWTKDWAVHSGCIWDPSGITNYKLITIL
jgi:hypothetical protein